jgi:hypothetical protein
VLPVTGGEDEKKKAKEKITVHLKALLTGKGVRGEKRLVKKTRIYNA